MCAWFSASDDYAYDDAVYAQVHAFEDARLYLSAVEAYVENEAQQYHMTAPKQVLGNGK